MVWRKPGETVTVRRKFSSVSYITMKAKRIINLAHGPVKPGVPMNFTIMTHLPGDASGPKRRRPGRMDGRCGG